MTHPRQQALVDRMRVLQRSSPEIQAAALISPDGLQIASVLNPQLNPERLAAMSASLLSLGESIGNEASLGALEQVHIQGTDGHVVLMAVGDQAVLTTRVAAEAKMGILLLDMRHAAEDLLKILVPSGS